MSATLNPSAAEHVPPRPKSFKETGLPKIMLQELILKHMSQSTTLAGYLLASKLRLDWVCVEEIVEELTKNELLRVLGQAERVPAHAAGGRAAFEYEITDSGKQAAQTAMEHNKYVGFAPVPLVQYNMTMLRQGLPDNFATPDKLAHALRDLVLPDKTLMMLGPALNSRSSIFIYGKPGTGKSTIARQCKELLKGDSGNGIYLPFAIAVDEHIIRFYDQSYHKAVGAASPSADQRWIRSERPFVQVGGELSLDMLDLVYHESYGFYEAGLQMKACGGVFLVDDFGRQAMEPRKLLNRFIIPLEERIDFLNMPGAGRKIETPFNMLLFFSTNLHPTDLVDEAFLRRIRYKVRIENPTPDEFREIFVRECAKQNIRAGENPREQYELAADYIIAKQYERKDAQGNPLKDEQGKPLPRRPMRGVHPRDILIGAKELSAFMQRPFELGDELLDQACDAYFLEHLLAVDDEEPVIPASTSAA